MTLAPPLPWLFDLADALARRIAVSPSRPAPRIAAPAPRPERDADKDRAMLARAFEGRLSAHLRRDIGADGL